MKNRWFNIVIDLHMVVACHLQKVWKMGWNLWVCTFLLICQTTNAQRTWDGGAGDGSWTSGANWYPDGVPGTGEDILLDNKLVAGDYDVTLPTGNTGISVNSLTIRPVAGRTIRMVIPAGNTAAPALMVIGQGESIRLDAGAILVNASGAASGDPLQLSGLLRISDGARYIHATPRANTRLIDRLSTATGTSRGVFEFDVPGTSGYTVSLTGNTFGSLWFRSSSAGGLKSYSGSGASDLYIRGDLVVDSGAGLTSTMTACIRLDGNLIVRGMLSLQPATAGTTGRCLWLASTDTCVVEAGNILFQQHFRETKVAAGRTALLKGAVQMPHAGQWLRILENGTLSAGEFPISGAGGLDVASGATIRLGHPAGVLNNGNDGNIRTAVKQLPKDARYVFDGTGEQQTGDGLPDSISILCIDKPDGALWLTRSLQVTGELHLIRGRLITSDSTILRFSGDKISHHANDFGMDSCGWSMSFVDGPMVRSTSKSGRLAIPIGRDAKFAPIVLHRPAYGSAAFRISYTSSSVPHAHILKDPRIHRITDAGYWTLKMEELTNDSNVYPELPWRFDGDSITRSRLQDSLHVAAAGDGVSSGWVILDDRPAILGTGMTGTIRSDSAIPASTLLALAMGSTAIGLPITGIKLEARRIGTATRLEWTTAGYSGKTRFLIHRTDEKGYSDTAGILMASQTQSGDRFMFTDTHPSKGWNIYKVCADEEGDIDVFCSAMVPVFHPGTKGIRLYPNPAEDWIRWAIPDEPVQGEIDIFQADGGRKFQGLIRRERNGMIHLKGWKPGIYMFSIQTERTTYLGRFLKK
jgi:hypothetical protein